MYLLLSIFFVCSIIGQGLFLSVQPMGLLPPPRARAFRPCRVRLARGRKEGKLGSEWAAGEAPCCVPAQRAPHREW
ncbi:hypothetical protein V8C26DRAFT_412371 [Trichoderma gracile]